MGGVADFLWSVATSRIFASLKRVISNRCAKNICESNFNWAFLFSMAAGATLGVYSDKMRRAKAFTKHYERAFVKAADDEISVGELHRRWAAVIAAECKIFFRWCIASGNAMHCYAGFPLLYSPQP